MRPFRVHDEMEYEKLVDWQRQVKTKGANKEKLGGGNVTHHVNLPVSLSPHASMRAHTGVRPYRSSGLL